MARSAPKGALQGEERKIYDAVLAAVMAGRLPPGTKLKEAELSELFGLSRNVVRLGLLRLGHDHIVDLTPNRGATVASPSVQDARDVYSAQRVLECGVLPQVAGRITARDLERLRALVEAQREAFDAGDYQEWMRLTSAFHVELVELAGNRVLTQYARELVTRALLISAMYKSPGSLYCATRERLELLDALAEGDVARAVKVLDEFLAFCLDQLDLERSQDQPLDLRRALEVRR